MKQFDTLIVGAGIAGLTAAHTLQKNGKDPLILEKSLAVGGRMATRRMGEAVLDHGAQFFTVRTNEFQSLVDLFTQNRIAKIWCHGFQKKDGHARYCGVQSMTGIPKWLAQHVPIEFDKRVTDIAVHNSKLHLQLESKESYQSNSVIITAPLPQTLDLIQQSDFPVDSNLLSQMKSIEYDPCIALLCVMDQESGIPAEGGVQVQNEIIDFIADNYKKGISPIPAVTIHASANFSREYYDTDDETVSQIVLESAMEWLPNPPIEVQVKRWKYSKPKSTLHQHFMQLSQSPSVLLAGDAFGGAKVEGSALSGWNAALQIVNNEPV